MSEPIRFSDDRRTVFSFLDEVLVGCSRCGRCAVVRPAEADAGWFAPRRLVCGSCGLSRSLKPRTVLINARGVPVDPYFRLPLWLATGAGQHQLWAYNLRHLEHIEAFVRATLRSHSPTASGCSNCSLISRLPRWVKLASNRQRVLRLIDRLRARSKGP